MRERSERKKDETSNSQNIINFGKIISLRLIHLKSNTFEKAQTIISLEFAYITQLDFRLLRNVVLKKVISYRIPL